jgi:hypothetical protein
MLKLYLLFKDCISITSGTIQGSHLSPLQFILITEDLQSKISGKNGGKRKRKVIIKIEVKKII